MADRATITIHTSPETRARLERLAASTQRSKSFLGNAAIEQYLAAEEAFLNGVEQGLQDADAGRTVSGAELKAALHEAIDRETAKTS